MSLPQQLHDTTLASLTDKLDLHEINGTDGGAYLPLISQLPMAQGQIGGVRLFRGNNISRVISCSIVVPAMQMDSHMLFAFTDTHGLVPHFTVDSVHAGGTFAYHLDLIPRLDLGTELEYMDEAFAPLTNAFKAHADTDGLSKADLDPRQYAVMSPWMLVNRADEAAFKATFATVNTYLEHWFQLLNNGVKATGSATQEQRAARDKAHRSILFNPQVDKVWAQITPLVGEDAVAQMLDLLTDTSALEISA